MKRILAAIGNALGVVLGIVSIPVGLFMGLLFMALPIVFVLWVLGVWPVDDNTNESSPVLSSAITDCDNLRALVDEGKSAHACLDVIGGEAGFDARLAYFEDLIPEEQLTPDEAIALFDDWLAAQSPDCDIWVGMMQALDNCP